MLFSPRFMRNLLSGVYRTVLLSKKQRAILFSKKKNVILATLVDVPPATAYDTTTDTALCCSFG